MASNRQLLLAAALFLAAAAPRPASANDRHFGYSYESAVLSPGQRELEIWNTWRTGRGPFYSQVDHRIEFEVGLVDRLQTAFYLNLSAVTEQGDGGERQSRFVYRGISSEWKYKLLDPVADPLGLTLYGELEASTDLLALETKIIVDKRMGGVLLAGNIIGEREWSFASTEVRRETEVEATFAAAFFFTPTLAFGLEGRARGELEGSELEYAAAYVGPALAYAQSSWWAVITPMRQLPALKRDQPRAVYVTRDHELFDLRLLFSFHL